MNEPTKKGSDMLPYITFAIGLALSGFGAWMTMDSRITRIETTVENAHLAEIPSRLAGIETLLRQRESAPK